MAVERDVILKGLVGSHAYGLAHEGSDEDFLGVWMAHTSELFGLNPPRDKSASVVTKDPDTQLHEVGKYVHLALAMNPTITELMWLDEWVVSTWAGDALVSNRHSFLSQRCRATYGGYATQQVKRLEAARAADEMDVTFGGRVKKRTAKHGRHVFRLILQCEHLLREGEVLVRLSPEQAAEVMLMGEFAEVNPEAYELLAMRRIQGLDDIKTRLPERPNVARLNSFLVNLRYQKDQRDRNSGS